MIPSSTPARSMWRAPLLSVSVLAGTILAGWLSLQPTAVPPSLPSSNQPPVALPGPMPTSVPFTVKRQGGLEFLEEGQVRFHLVFSHQVSHEELAKMLKASTLDGKSLATELNSVSWREAIVEVLPPKGAQEFMLDIGSELLLTDGQRPLAQPLRLRIELGARPELAIHSLVAESSGNEDGFKLIVRFSGKVDPESAVKFIVTDPPVELSMRAHPWESGQYFLDGDFKPQTFYKVTFKQGLMAGNGQVLANDQVRNVATGDLDPKVRFISDGPYFPSGRQLELPVRVQNLAKIKATLFRVYPNNLLRYLQQNELDATARKVTSSEFETGVLTNGLQDISLPLEKLIGGRTPGLYRVFIRPLAPGASRRDYDYNYDYYGYYGDNRQRSRLVVVTDLGLSAATGRERVLATVLSLNDGKPVAGAALEVVSRKNQVLGTAVSSDTGQATILLGAIDPEDRPQLLIARKGEDLSYLQLEEQRHDLSQFPDAGRPHAAPQQACEALVYAERGACRPGESIQIFAQVRNAATLAAASGIPAELVVRDPTSRVFLVRSVTPDAFGCLRSQIDIPREARTGNYSVTLGIPDAAAGHGSFPEWGSCSFLVGSYVPDRLKVSLTPEVQHVAPAVPVALKGNAKFYFGTPASQAKVKMQVAPVSVPFTPSGWKGYDFGDPERKWSVPSFTWTGKTDESGNFACDYPGFADSPQPPAAVALLCYASVQEEGGRAITATRKIAGDPTPWNIGLRRHDNTEGDSSQEVAFDWAAVDPEGKLATVPQEGLTYELYRESWHHLLIEEDGSYRYRWETQQEKIQGGAVAGANGQERGQLKLSLPEGGHFVLVVAAAGGRIQTRCVFWHWWGEASTRSADPSILSVTTDKERYQPGETAEIRFTAAAPGLAIITAGASEADTLMSTAVSAGENRLKIPIPASLPFGSWHAGITVVHADTTPARTPRRLFGLVRLEIDQNAHRLQVGLKVPELSRPGGTVPVQLTLADGHGKPAAGEVELWAVDEGILALTNYKTPDPLGHFFGPRSCAMEFIDLYDSLYPWIPTGKESAVGGDGSLGGLLNSFQPDELPPALVRLPPVLVPDSGRADLQLNLPDHTGALRLMAVAASKTGAGMADQPIILRAATSVIASGPRAVVPADEFEIVFQGFNHELPETQAHWQIQTSGPLKCLDAEAGELRLPKGGKTLQRLRFRAGPGVGPASIAISLVAGEAKSTTTLNLSVRPNQPPQSFSQTDVVASGNVRELVPPGTWIPGTAQATLTLSSSPAVELNGAMQWLQNYPYGCVEQTTSAAFPFLGVAALVQSGTLPAGLEQEARLKIVAGVNRLSLMERPSGGFSMWPGGSDLWMEGSLFAAHFLVEADRSGVALDPERKRRLVSWLKQIVNDRGQNDSYRAYATYIASLAGVPVAGTAAELVADAKSPFSRFLAAAALIRSGRAKEGKAALDRILLEAPWEQAEPDWRIDSNPRRLGMSLWILMDTAPDSSRAMVLAERLRATLRRDGHWGSTHANAWAALGLARWAAAYGAGKGAGRVTLPDGRTIEIANGQQRQIEKLAANTKVRIDSRGEGALFAHWDIRGSSTTPPAAGPVQIRRSYLNAQGEAVTQVTQGETVTVVLTLKSPAPIYNLVLADLLPGGLEIEDERLATRWSPVPETANPKRQDPLRCRFLEKRDDRFLLFGDLMNDQETTFSYTTRAVSKGRYGIPPAHIEAMYDPELQGTSTEAGTLEVK